MNDDDELYQQILNHLRARQPCPEQTWQKLLSTIEGKPLKTHWLNIAGAKNYIGYLAIAAVILISIGIGILLGHKTPQSQSQYAESSIPSFLMFPEDDQYPWQEITPINPAVPTAIISIHDNRHRLTLNNEASYQFVAVRERCFENEPVTELLVRRTDGEVAKLVAAPRGGAAASAMGKALASGNLRAARTFGNSLVGVLGNEVDADLVKFLNLTQDNEANDTLSVQITDTSTSSEASPPVEPPPESTILETYVPNEGQPSTLPVPEQSALLLTSGELRV